MSDKLNLNFKNNLITVSQNVKYGIQGTITADNVKIDLITKNIEIYMDNTKDNVRLLQIN